MSFVIQVMLIFRDITSPMDSTTAQSSKYYLQDETFEETVTIFERQKELLEINMKWKMTCHRASQAQKHIIPVR